jgi:hypothetical protein
MIPQQLDSFTFSSYYDDCMIDGMDVWDAIYYLVNYLPTKYDCNT